jgi:hypothetical protein
MAEGDRHHNAFAEREFNGLSAVERDRPSRTGQPFLGPRTRDLEHRTKETVSPVAIVDGGPNLLKLPPRNALGPFS